VNDQVIPDVLADRYASRAMRQIWSQPGRVILERELWIAVMRAERALGVDIPEEAIAAYERVKESVDLESIRARERVIRHDVKARIDEFCALAGAEHVHKGLTSRDVTENVEQLQILRSLELLRVKAGAALHRLAARALEYRDVTIVGRTHNVPAQATTLGKRLAMFGTELLHASRRLEELRARYPLRGLKGPVGTQLDLLTLLDDDRTKVAALEKRIAADLGFASVLGAVGQVYPRSLDFEVLSVLVQLGAGPDGFAKTLRLMAGHGLAAEGFKEDQVGSSAMPHKINSRSCERMNGLALVLKGYLEMVAGLAGDQWNEGDVSCSVVRRVALPGSMFAADGLFETFLTVLSEMEVFPAMLAVERERELPFLATTTILVEAVKRGAGRETAHAAIREHALAATRLRRSGAPPQEVFLDCLAGDQRIGLDRRTLAALVEAEARSVGAAREQVDAFVDDCRAFLRAVPEAEVYQAEEIL
jgi:adenylosuccinate lyase